MHKGLGLDAYVQAISPVRRSCDLAVHYQLKAFLRGDSLPFTGGGGTTVVMTMTTRTTIVTTTGKILCVFATGRDNLLSIGTLGPRVLVDRIFLTTFL